MGEDEWKRGLISPIAREEYLRVLQAIHEQDNPHTEFITIADAYDLIEGCRDEAE